jgi:hypothetical protein
VIFKGKASIKYRPEKHIYLFRNVASFYGKELLAPRPTPKLEDYALSAVRDCLFNIFAATLHIRGRSSIRILSTRHAVVTGPTYHGSSENWLGAGGGGHGFD